MMDDNSSLATNTSNVRNSSGAPASTTPPALPAWMTAPRDPAKDAAALGVNAPVASGGASVINGISTPASVTQSVDRRVTPGAPAAPGVSAVPGGPAVVPGASAGPAGAIAGPAQATPGQATTPGATAGPSGARTSPAPPSTPPGTLAQGLGPAAPAPGAPGTLAQGPMPAMPQQWDPQSALAFAKHVQNWAKGHQSAAALRDRWGANFPTPGTTQSGPGATQSPGAAFSPTVAAHVAALTRGGWQHVQANGQHFLVGKDGRRVRFDPTTGAMSVVSNGQAPTLAQGVVPTAQVG